MARQNCLDLPYVGKSFYLRCFILFKYIRLHAEADVNDAIDLLLKHWNLSQPELLISIIGDDKITELNPKLASVISQGLTQVSLNILLR